MAETNFRACNFVVCLNSFKLQLSSADENSHVSSERKAANAIENLGSHGCFTAGIGDRGKGTMNNHLFHVVC